MMIVDKLRESMRLFVNCRTSLGIASLAGLLCVGSPLAAQEPPARAEGQSVVEPSEAKSSDTDAPSDVAGFAGGIYGMGGGMGGMAAGTSLGLPISAIPGRDWVDGGRMIVAIADDGKQAFAYCEEHPRWVAQDIDVQDGVKTIPVVGTSIAAVWHGPICYAYSTTLGVWDTLRLPDGEVATPSIGGGGFGLGEGASSESVTVTSKTKGDFVFKINWGKWFSAQEIKDGKVAEHLQSQSLKQSVEERGTETAIIPLVQYKASAAIEILGGLYADAANKLTLAEDVRGNQIIIRGPRPLITEITAILEQLDTSAAVAESPQETRGEPKVSVDELRKQFTELEQQSARVATVVRELDPKSTDSDQAQEELKGLVRKSFAARQALELAELDAFAQRLQTARQAITARDAIAEQIVKRRVEELLDPNVNWNTDAASPQIATGKQSSTDDQSSTGKPSDARATEPPKGNASTQIKILMQMTSVNVGKIQWIEGPDFCNYISLKTQFQAESGSKLEFRATEIPKLPGERVLVQMELMELSEVDAQRLQKVLEHNILELPYGLADLEKACEGTAVKKIVYLPSDLSTASDDSLFNALDCGLLPAGTDPVAHGKTLGIPIIALTVSQIGPKSVDPQSVDPRIGFHPEDFVKRFDSNKNDQIDPEEMTSPMKFALERLAKNNPKIDLTRPVPIELLASEMRKMQIAVGTADAPLLERLRPEEKVGGIREAAPISMEENSTREFTVDKAIERIRVVDPKIANVLIHGDRLQLSASQAGVTKVQVVFADDTFYTVEVIVREKAE